MRQTFPEATVKAFLKQNYGLDVQELSSFTAGVIDTNYHVVADKHYVFKIFNSGLPLEEIRQQLDFMIFCKQQAQPVQAVYPAKNGELIVSFEDIPAVLLEYIDGEMIKEVALTEGLLTDLGTVIAEFQEKTREYAWPQIDEKHKADFLHFLQFEKYAETMEDKKALLTQIIQEYKQALPRIKECRMATVHHDFTHENTLIKDGRIAGVVDFGNATHTILVADIIISISAVCFSREKPFTTAKILFQAYTKHAPLNAIEKKLLYTLFKVRFTLLCLWAQGEILDDRDCEGIRWYRDYSYEFLESMVELGEKGFLEALGV